MATFNKKTVSKVAFSPIQKDGASNEEKTIIIMFEDGTQQTIQGGLQSLSNDAEKWQKSIDTMQSKVNELNEFKDFFLKNTK